MSDILNKAIEARWASKLLGIASVEEKNKALQLIAGELVNNAEDILAANTKDIENAVQNGTPDHLIDRLRLDIKRIEGIAEGVRQVKDLEDPIGQVVEKTTRPNGLVISKVRVPMGVLGVIYEARPNVTADCAALAIKTGNAIVLRGSGSAINSNIAITKAIKNALAKTSLPVQSVSLCEDVTHGSVGEMLTLRDYIDVIIPRGSGRLISRVVNESKIPVLETGVGNCSVFINYDADPKIAVDIVLNAKTQRPSVCNAAESLLIHKDYPETVALLDRLTEKGVLLHGCPEICKIYKDAILATDEDYGTEYLGLEMSVKSVNSVDEAIQYVDKYGTGHTECIVTENKEDAKSFMTRCDAAVVNHNASTRFTDGFEFGFGAEIGISTQKLHARGPLGLKELTSYKYLVEGDGQVRG